MSVLSQKHFTLIRQFSGGLNTLHRNIGLFGVVQMVGTFKIQTRQTNQVFRPPLYIRTRRKLLYPEFFNLALNKQSHLQYFCSEVWQPGLVKTKKKLFQSENCNFYQIYTNPWIPMLIGNGRRCSYLSNQLLYLLRCLE